MGRFSDNWAVSDAFWERVEPLIPVRQRDAAKEYRRKPGGGRKPKPARTVFEGILYVLRTGCQWKALPKERFGSASAIHARFLEWGRSGFFVALWRAGLAEHDEMDGIAWEWRSTGETEGESSSDGRRTGEKSPEGEKTHASITAHDGRMWRPIIVYRKREERQ